MDFANRRKLILLVTFAGRRDGDAGRIANFSRALNLYDTGALPANSFETGVYLFYRESQTSNDGLIEQFP